MRHTQRQRVTGLIVNERINIPRGYVRSLRNILYIWRQHGEAVATASFERTNPHPNWPPEKPPPSFQSVVRGRVQYVGSVKGWNDPVYTRLAAALHDVDASFRATLSAVSAVETIPIYTEGVSDNSHLAAAARYFADRGEFTDLALEISEEFALGGDDALLKRCESLALTRQPRPCVCLFDRDNQKVLLRAVGSGAWKNWGNGVAALALVPPPWRDPDAAVCVEMLHDQDVLQRTDSEGRRVFLLEEFDRVSGHHESRRYTTPNPQNRTLVREVVHEIETGRSVGLAKVAFADAVKAKAEPFQSVSFEGFRATFELIRQAVREIVGEADAKMDSGER